MASASVARHEPDRARSPAQWFCLLGGITLIAAGIWGFLIGDVNWDTGDSISGPEVAGLFEVNGWHNVVHLATGAFLLASMGTTVSARFGALVFAILYTVVTVWGFVEGDTVFWLIPTNTADNILHLALAGVGFLAYAASEARAQTTHDRDREGRFDTASTGESRPRDPAGRV